MPERRGKKRKNSKVRFTSNSSKSDSNVIMDTVDSSALYYTQAVRQRFKQDPNIFHQFLHILEEIKQPNVDIVDLINQVVILFDGQVDLLTGFNSFLPRDYQIQVQNDAVLIKVYEQVAQENSTNNIETEESLGYVRQVKHIFHDQQHVYESFIQLLAEFHRGEVDHMQTIRRVLELFHDHSELITGFNTFLPQGYRISKYDTNSFVVHQPRRYKQKKTVHYELD